MWPWGAGGGFLGDAWLLDESQPRGLRGACEQEGSAPPSDGARVPGTGEAPEQLRRLIPKGTHPRVGGMAATDPLRLQIGLGDAGSEEAWTSSTGFSKASTLSQCFSTFREGGFGNLWISDLRGHTPFVWTMTSGFRGTQLGGQMSQVCLSPNTDRGSFAEDSTSQGGVHTPSS